MTDYLLKNIPSKKKYVCVYTHTHTHTHKHTHTYISPSER